MLIYPCIRSDLLYALLCPLSSLYLTPPSPTPLDPPRSSIYVVNNQHYHHQRRTQAQERKSERTLNNKNQILSLAQIILFIPHTKDRLQETDKVKR